ncbi:MAG: hypothetical protein AVDCRST_MAG40-2796, partial [uncultured Gemmatimonadaceae bacterium]
ERGAPHPRPAKAGQMVRPSPCDRGRVGDSDRAPRRRCGSPGPRLRPLALYPAGRAVHKGRAAERHQPRAADDPRPRCRVRVLQVREQRGVVRRAAHARCRSCERRRHGQPRREPPLRLPELPHADAHLGAEEARGRRARTPALRAVRTRRARARQLGWIADGAASAGSSAAPKQL